MQCHTASHRTWLCCNTVQNVATQLRAKRCNPATCNPRCNIDRLQRESCSRAHSAATNAALGALECRPSFHHSPRVAPPAHPQSAPALGRPLGSHRWCLCLCGIRRAQKARALKESRTPGRDKQPANAARPTPPAARGAIEVDDINFGQLKCSSGLRGRPHCSRRNGILLATSAPGLLVSWSDFFWRGLSELCWHELWSRLHGIST